MKTRSELREIIIKILYQIYILDSVSVSYNLNDIIKEEMETHNEFVTTTITNIIESQTKINDIANRYLKDWTIDRLSKVDKAILSLGIYELLETDTPNIVCINEAVELAKKYSDGEVIKMINATLDSIYHNMKEE